MKKIIVVMALVVFTIGSANAQWYITKNGKISFFSETPIENIEAHNNQVNCAFDISTGDLVFKVLMKSFQFEKALMQEHFNESYVESDKYPNATFSGKVANIENFDMSQEGTYNVEVEGDLTIHGVTNAVKEKGVFEVMGDEIHGTTTFNIKLADYNIKIPNAVIDNISETIETDVDVLLKKL
jgi:polyisoprenoid-binding protein YceI